MTLQRFSAAIGIDYTRMRLKIDQRKCVGCGICAEGCSLHLLAVKHSKTYVKEGCTVCGECVNLCICSAISVENDEAPGTATQKPGSPFREDKGVNDGV
jgi:MinD superfamily P-loop ATPase